MPYPPDLTPQFAAFIDRLCPSVAELLVPEVRAGRPRGVQHLTLWDPTQQSWLFPTEPLAPRLHEITARQLASPDLKTWAFVLAAELKPLNLKQIELRHRTDSHRAAALYRSPEQYGWRFTPFEVGVGACGHGDYPTLFGALFAAMRSRFLYPDDGVVDRLFAK